MISLNDANAQVAAIDAATRTQADAEVKESAEDDASKTAAEAKVRAQQTRRAADDPRRDAGRERQRALGRCGVALKTLANYLRQAHKLSPDLTYNL